MNSRGSKGSTLSDHRGLLSDVPSSTEYRSEGTTTKENGKRGELNRLILDTWLWEITSMIFSILCFVAIVAVLGAYDQRERPSFPQGLTLNTIVSILATGSKSSLLCMVGASVGQLKWIWSEGDSGRRLHDLQCFDEASRGPWGSLTLLFHWPNKERLIVSIGAITTIASLAFDPFMQQIVDFPTRQVAGESDSARVKQVDVPWRLDSSGAVDTLMINSLNAGIWGNEFELHPICPSGNCTWPSFQSAGWCSKCEDFTREATIVGCDVGLLNISSHKPQNVSCNTTLPGGDWIKSDVHGVLERNMYAHAFEPEFLMKVPLYGIGHINDRLGPHLNETIPGIKNPLSAVAFVEIDSPITISSQDFKQPLTPRNSTVCALSPCVETYDVFVSDGIPHTRRSGSEFGEIFFDDQLPDQEHNIPPELIKSCWKPYADRAVDVTITQEKLPLQFDPWTNATHFAACPVMWDVTGSGLIDMTYRIYRFNTIIGKWDSSSSTSPEFLPYGAIRASSFDHVMSTIAASLTKYARERFGRELLGVVYEPKVFVKVQWHFIILPSTTMVLGLIFLILTICGNRNRGLPLWKSSILPLIYHGVDGDRERENLADDQTGTLGVVNDKRRLIRKS